MPTYEYKCLKGHKREREYPYADGPQNRIVCLVCGEAARLQVSAPAIIFKGSGFYSTDNRPAIDVPTDD